MSFVMVGVAVVGAGVKLYQGSKDRKERKRAQDKANKELANQKAKLAALDSSNPYADLENTYEDLTINQLQSDYETQQNQQNQANTLQALQGAAGGSGIAGLAQSIMNQGQLGAQKAAAGIGQQEASNQAKQAQQASTLQSQEAQGKQWVYNKQQEAITGQLSSARADKQAADDARSAAATQNTQAIGEIVGGIGGGVQAGMQNKQNTGSFWKSK